MCSPLDPLSCADAIAHGLADPVTDAVTGAVTTGLAGILSGLTEQLQLGIEMLSYNLAVWLLAGSTRVCPEVPGELVAACNNGDAPAAMVRGWLLPITALVAMLGILWQAITMTITRKGEPLLTVLKGLSAVALWGVVGIAGTQLALWAGDAYTFWVLKQAIFGDSLTPGRDVGEAIAGMAAHEAFTAAIVLLLLQIPFMFVTVVQVILMIFREGAVVILAGQLQLAAAGGFARVSSGWLGKVTAWMLALIAYKPIAATIYAVAFSLMGDGLRNLLMGLAVMVLAVIALPALMRLFNWTVGTVTTNGNSLGMLGTAFAAGLHGASAMRGLGGHSATDHARWLDTHGPGTGGGPGGAPPPPPGAGSGGPGPGAGPAGAAPAAGGGAAGGAGTAGSSGAASGAAASGAGASGATSAAAAAGPAGAAVAATVAVAQTAKQQVQRAAGAANDAMDGR
jgi:hypothetical protein